MHGCLALVLHAHLPFVRHPEHERFLEESWLFEAITETYVPLVQLLEDWRRDGIPARLTLSLSPTLCSMLRDPLLQDRYLRHLDGLLELAEKEILRTRWEPGCHQLALMYHHRFHSVRESYLAWRRDLVLAFKEFQDLGRIEIITCAATHAVLPLLAGHPPSVRAQILVARDHYRACFGREPRGLWLPECAYASGVETVLREAGLRWFIVETHGLLHATPRPRHGVFAPIFTPNGLAVFGRDPDSAKQVWSRQEGYPGDVRYRDFYRDLGFDLDFEYVQPYLPSPDVRGFTGLKYHRVTGPGPEKEIYVRDEALRAAAGHADHFLDARAAQIQGLARIMDRPPLVVAPYDAELFGHWWYEGPEFLDYLVRQTASGQRAVRLTTPQEYLEQNPTQQVAAPTPSSWGEGGHLRAWLNEANQWIIPHLRVAQERMSELAGKFPAPAALPERALRQAARELLLAQASDWPFILRTATSPDYARQRVRDHLLRFTELYRQLIGGAVDARWLDPLEQKDNIFPDVNWRYWAPP